jgi:1,4-alpha-glucan branching enzyme
METLIQPVLTQADVDALLGAVHSSPRSVLGYHEYAVAGSAPRCVVRVFEPGASEVIVHWEDEPIAKGIALRKLHAEGLFEGRLPHRRPLVPYRVQITYRDGTVVSKHDPYYFAPELSDFDLYLFGEGKHYGIHNKLGAHPLVRDGVAGTAFAVWAPSAKRVSVVGPFNLWDGRRNAMQPRGSSGIWELFVPGVAVGAEYKYEIRGQHDELLHKADPYGFAMQLRPGDSSIVASLEGYEWSDAEWLAQRAKRDPLREPISVYEVHLGSWQHAAGREPPFLNWQEATERLIPYVLEMGYTHIELMGVAEHPLDGSWGYQVIGYFAPSARFGAPQDFMQFVDRCHQAGIGVILDWVPGHFPKDAHGLARFDGSALYEHADPREGEHMDWGTKIFNYGRHEVRNFLVANALFWFERYHIDGLRVDAVASMLYRDYSRKAGEWIPNQYGGRENLEALAFLREFNTVAHARFPGVLTIAEESTAFPGVTTPVHFGGLGFNFKWNMGWMNDTLRYFAKDPVYRKFEHGLITFSFVYAWSEKFVLPISHDEVVHGKHSLLDKMPGDEWQKRANYRLFLTFMTAHPGKKLLFMGQEWGQWREWRESESIDWHLLEDEKHRSLQRLARDLTRFYKHRPQLHGSDHDGEGFRWIDLHNAADSLFAFVRFATHGDSGVPLVCVFNATPVPRDDYWVGVPEAGNYRAHIDSDAVIYGGSGYRTQQSVTAVARECHGFPYTIRVQVPPLAGLILQRE